MDLIDTHAHLADEQLASDLPGVLDRARTAGVTTILAVGITLESSLRVLDLAREHQGVHATVGIHPNEILRAGAEDWDRLVTLSTAPEVVGIGETGLDRYWDDTPFPIQEEWFRRHLELGRLRDRAVVIHCREAEPDVLRLLTEAFDAHGPIRAVMHSFTGSAQTAASCLAMGLYLSFAGMLTYKNAANLREVAATVPLDRLLVETDCPYLAPVPLRGRRNEPAHVVHTATCLAGVLGLDLETLATQTTNNARRLFGLERS